MEEWIFSSLKLTMGGEMNRSSIGQTTHEFRESDKTSAKGPRQGSWAFASKTLTMQTLAQCHGTGIV